MLEKASLSHLPSFLVGHAQDERSLTGCTVIVAPKGATLGVDVRGGGPATRETDLLRPENMIQKAHAVVLSGGSAFGLAASTGVMEELARRNIGFMVGNVCVPIVSGACLFDLLIGNNTHPDAAMGKTACQHAFSQTTSSRPPLQGNIGAGCGTTVGKLLGGKGAMKTGLGVAGVQANGVITVAIVALNALGNVCDRNGTWIAGVRDANDCIIDPLKAALMAASSTQQNPSLDDSRRNEEDSTGICPNTTIGIILTNATLTKAQANKTSGAVHDAYARRIKPVHTSSDGDTIFTFASGEIEADQTFCEILATEAMEQAIEQAVITAQPAGGLPSYQSLFA